MSRALVSALDLEASYSIACSIHHHLVITIVVKLSIPVVKCKNHIFIDVGKLIIMCAYNVKCVPCMCMYF